MTMTMNTDLWEEVLLRLPLAADLSIKRRNAVLNRVALVNHLFHDLCTTTSVPVVRQRAATWHGQPVEEKGKVLWWCRDLAVQSYRFLAYSIASLCPKLEYLNLNFSIMLTSAGGDSLETLFELCPNLVDLRWRNCRYSIHEGDFYPVAMDLSSCVPKGLTALDLSYTRFFTDTAAHSLVQAAGDSLQELQLEATPGVYTATSAIASGCPNLHTLNLSDHRSIDLGWVQQLACAPRIVTLKLRNCDNFEDAALATLLPACPLLRHLDIGGCLGITDVGVCFVGGEKLQSLDVSCCSLGNEGVYKLATSCTELVTLDISENHASDFEVILLRCKRLKQFVY